MTSDPATLYAVTAWEDADPTDVSTLEELEGCTPVYEEFPGFTEDISNLRRYEDLPEVCRSYIARLEELCECPVKMIGVGPERDQVIER